ncbi:MAG: DUF3298 domain-containing protein [Microscillaceae bacterium]|nr:DUF3298 domain-containing protein [Microscillaceae bacterium]
MKFKFFLTLFFWVGLVSHVVAQSYFYKQFKGKVGEREIWATLIYAPSKDNPQFNLRGQYQDIRQGQRIQLTNGHLDALGNVYLEEGLSRRDYNGQPTFAKTGVFYGVYYSQTGRLEGDWDSADGKRSLTFFLTEDYGNGALPAEIIFNDAHLDEAEIRFHYPRFLEKASARALNQFIQANILGNVPEKISQFMQKFQEEKSLGGMIELFESSHITYIRLNENNLLSLEYASAEFTGGPHGVYKSLFYNFNTETGQMLTLSDVLAPGYETALTKLAEQALRRNYGIKAEESLADYGFTLAEGQFKLTNNFYLKPEGIGFYYNVYEIAPFAVGPQDIFVPFAQLKELIRKNSPLMAYLK